MRVVDLTGYKSGPERGITLTGRFELPVFLQHGEDFGRG